MGRLVRVTFAPTPPPPPALREQANLSPNGWGRDGFSEGRGRQSRSVADLSLRAGGLRRRGNLISEAIATPTLALSEVPRGRAAH